MCSPKRYRDRLLRMGFERIGWGTFSDVYHRAGDDYVIKISRGQKATFDGFWDYAMLVLNGAFGEGNPHVPVVHRLKAIRFRAGFLHKRFYVCKVEKLAPVKEGSPMQQFGWDIAYQLDQSRMWRKRQRIVDPHLVKVIDVLRDASRSRLYDLATQNVMVRGDTIVVNDPLYVGSGQPPLRSSAIRSAQFQKAA